VPKSYGKKKTNDVGTSTISTPHGKWAWYDVDGNYIAEEGFYTGIQDPKEPWNIVLRQVHLKGKKEKEAHSGAFKSYTCNCTMDEKKKTYTIHNGKKGGIMGVGARELPKLVLV
jgi:hypothetical protein